MSRRKFTYDEVKHFIEVESNSGCKLLSKQYIRSKEKLEIQCRCGNKYEVSFDMFKSRKQYKCQLCRCKTRWNYDLVNEFITNNSDCKLLSSEYINQGTLMNFQCICGEIYKTTFDRFKNLNKRQCGKCTNKIHWTYSTVKNFIESKSGCTLLSTDYTNNRTPLKVKCLCGNIFNPTFGRFKDKNQRQCEECSIQSKIKKLLKTNDEFIQEVNDLTGDEYIFLENYVDNRTKIKCKHNICKNTWEITPDNFLRGRRCPYCVESIGEKQIRFFLDSKNIYHTAEYSFNNLVGIGGGLLRFDFAIFNSKHNEQIKFLVEYDGEQHYKHIDGMMSECDFETLQMHDERKNQYCKDNSIPLLRIPYWDYDNIEQILNKWLSKYGLIHSEKIECII